MLPLAAMAFFVFGGVSSVQAEQSKGLTPAGELLMGMLRATDGSRPSYAPIKLQADCSAELGECWDSHGLNKDNDDQVMDACWKETKKCPKVCRDQYFRHRKAGMKGARADDAVLFGKPSCIPGLDKQTHPVKKANSILRMRVTVGGQTVSANFDLIPLDDQGHERQKAFDGSFDGSDYSIETVGNTPDGWRTLRLPAGQYRLRVRSPDRNYHPNQKFMPYQAFPEQTEVIKVKAEQTLDKTYTFGIGRLVVKAQDKNGSPVLATLELRRWDRPNYILYRHKLPLEISLVAGKYRGVVRETQTRKSVAVDIDIKDGRTTARTMTFEAGTGR